MNKLKIRKKVFHIGDGQTYIMPVSASKWPMPKDLLNNPEIREEITNAVNNAIHKAFNDFLK